MRLGVIKTTYLASVRLEAEQVLVRLLSCSLTATNPIDQTFSFLLDIILIISVKVSNNFHVLCQRLVTASSMYNATQLAYGKHHF